MDFLPWVAPAHPLDILPDPVIRYRHHSGQITASEMWEREQRPRSAWLQLRAAWQLRLPPLLWVFPVAAYLYSNLPLRLRPRRWKTAVKRYLLRRFART